ncbi:MAG TPA: hypothetical protein VKF35_07775, partial [Hyphomicrobiaceae bacterium]|nr:hypothetical protein [Hyphomicrobiaceae bacterium]
MEIDNEATGNRGHALRLWRSRGAARGGCDRFERRISGAKGQQIRKEDHQEACPEEEDDAVHVTPVHG